jgi:hypothetical protein
MKNRTLILSLELLAVLAVIIVLGYFIYLFSTICGTSLQATDYAGKVYTSRDHQIILEFDDTASSATLRSDGVESYKSLIQLSFDDNIFYSDSGVVERYFLVIDYNTLYSSDGIYLYLAQYETS